MNLTNSSNNQSNTKIQSFLEQLRASRTQNPKSDRSEIFADNNPFKEVQAKKEIEKHRIDLFHEARQREWNSVYSSKNKEVSQKLENIRLQLKSLIKQVGKLDKNLEKAVEKPIIDPGIYHETFFDHIQHTIQLLNKSVNSANTWLEIFNQRSSKKGYYSTMAKRGGSAYTQSNERVIATSVG